MLAVYHCACQVIAWIGDVEDGNLAEHSMRELISQSRNQNDLRDDHCASQMEPAPAEMESHRQLIKLFSL